MAKKYLVRDAKQLAHDFYTRFDEGFIFRRVDTLAFIVDQYDAFKKFAGKKGGAIETSDKKYLEGLRAEIHFAEIHQAECLFALMIAPFQSLPHWLYLTTYTTGEIREAMKAFLDCDISKLTGSRVKTPEEFVDRAVYMGFKTVEPAKAERWNMNLENIVWVLRMICQKFLAADEYNAYKHGLRVMTGETGFMIYPENRPDLANTLAHSEDSLTYLEIKRADGDTRQVFQTVKHFSWVESYNLILIMRLLLETIKATRLAKLDKKPGTELHTFLDLDRERLLDGSGGTRWSISA